MRTESTQAVLTDGERNEEDQMDSETESLEETHKVEDERALLRGSFLTLKPSISLPPPPPPLLLPISTYFCDQQNLSYGAPIPHLNQNLSYHRNVMPNVLPVLSMNRPSPMLFQHSFPNPNYGQNWVTESSPINWSMNQPVPNHSSSAGFSSFAQSLMCPPPPPPSEPIPLVQHSEGSNNTETLLDLNPIQVQLPHKLSDAELTHEIGK